MATRSLSERISVVTRSAIDAPELYGLFHKIIASVPARAWAAAMVVGLIDVAFGLARWRGVELSGAGLWGGVGAYIAALIAAVYVVCILTTGLKPTATGGLRFAGAYIGALLPVLASLTLLLVAGKDGSGRLLGMVGIVGLIPTVALLAMLPAWPPAQAASPTIVSPLRVLAATKGHRWKLFVIFWVLGALNKITPELSPGDGTDRAAMVALIWGVVTTVSVVVFACVHLAAWTLAARTDAGLSPPAGSSVA